MARAITAGVMLFALATAGSAPAWDGGSQSYSGTFELGGAVSFVREDGTVPAVRQISIHHIRIICQPRGNGKYGYHIHGDTPILSDRSFEVHSNDGRGVKALVRGRFSHTYERATGVARVYGNFPNPEGRGSIPCDSGKQAFLAR